MASNQIPEPLQCKTVFNRYLSSGRSNPKISKNEVHFFFEFWFWEDPPHPVNWSPTHSTGPQTLFFTDISVTVAQIKKFQKTRCIFFSNFASGRTIPTHSTGPQPIQLVPKHCFYRYLSNGRSNPKISKNEVHFLLNFASGRTLHTHSTGPQPIQLVPKHCF